MTVIIVNQIFQSKIKAWVVCLGQYWFLRAGAKSQHRKSESKGVLSMSNIKTENFGWRNALLVL